MSEADSNVTFFGGEDRPARRPVESAPRRIEVQARKRQRGTEETIHAFTMRCRVEASNRFIEYCEDERISYREGFDRLIAMLDSKAAE